MIRVTIEAVNGDLRRREAVQAESILGALETARRQNPGCEVGVIFPIDPEAFFVRDRAAQSGQTTRIPAA
jgi:hypothetical protein